MARKIKRTLAMTARAACVTIVALFSSSRARRGSSRAIGGSDAISVQGNSR